MSGKGVYNNGRIRCHHHEGAKVMAMHGAPVRGSGVVFRELGQVRVVVEQQIGWNGGRCGNVGTGTCQQQRKLEEAQERDQDTDRGKT